MSDPVKIAMIVAASVIVAVLLWIYFSPYRSCVRAVAEGGQHNPEAYCLALSGRR